MGLMEEDTFNELFSVHGLLKEVAETIEFCQSEDATLQWEYSEE